MLTATSRSQVMALNEPARRALSALRPLPLVGAIAWLAHPGRGALEPAPDLSQALATALRADGLEADPAEVFWLDAPAGTVTSLWRHPRAVVRARREGEPADIYVTSVRLTPEGRLLAEGPLYNVSDTSAVDETHVTVNDRRIAWAIGDDRIYSVHLADVRGDAPPVGDEWSRTKRWQQAVTNLQETGQGAGIGRRSFKLDPAAERVTLDFTTDALLIDADGRRISIPTNGAQDIEGARFVQEQPHHRALPGNLVTWAVDRVRNASWFGNDRMQVVKAVAFRGLDIVEQFVGNVTGDDGSERVKEEMGELVELPVVEYTNPETGWPPAPLETALPRPLEGEGKWRPLDNDPFIRKNPEAPTPFVTTFLRVDRERQFDQIWVTMWDPRQVELHMMSGTVEPKSATGETGPGLIPRKPEVMGRLLAGLNGGFQALHGEYGMMADGVVYLPPKPYAATITHLADGSNGFGTWPNDETVPPEVLSFRQNMTPMIQDGVINPYKRNWWGGVPPGWENESRTTRSAICMTEEGFIGYFYGASTDDVHLLEMLKRARCRYAIHLDMNAGHTGLEYYYAAPTAELGPLGRALDRRWEAEGEVTDMPGWSFRGRRMLRYMGLMNFPRYIQRESRDFFYLTLRHVLPGAPLESRAPSPEPTEGKWVVKDLPQHGWPYALATTWVRPSAARPDTKVRLLELDPAQLRLAEANDDLTRLVVAFTTEPRGTEGTTALWLQRGRLTIAKEAPGVGSTRLATGYLPGEPGARQAVGAIGIAPGGLFMYAEIATEQGKGDDPKLLHELLGKLGCREVLLLDEPLGAAVGGLRDLGGHPVKLTRRSIRLVRGEGPGARRVFTTTPIVEPNVWYPLQSKRVRYFKKKEPPAADAAAAPTSAAPPDAPE